MSTARAGTLPAAPVPPFGLRELLGMASPVSNGDDVALLLRLREVQRDLDVYAAALRAQVRSATEELVSRLDDRRPERARRRSARPWHPSCPCSAVSGRVGARTNGVSPLGR